MGQAIQEGAGGNDDGAGGDGAAIAQMNAGDAAVFDGQGGDFGLLDAEVRLLFEDFAHAGAVHLLIHLGAGGPDGGAAAGVEEAELDADGVGDFAHDAAEGIDFADEVTFGDTADGGVAGHLRDEVEVHGDHGGAETHAGGGTGGFASGVTGSDDHDVVLLGHCYDCTEMKILVLGSGGREHGLAWKLAQSRGVEVFGAPGNPGIAQVGTCVPAEDGSPEALLAAAEAVGADLTVVGPEAPLVSGVVDAFRARGRRIVGPNREAARLEGSKIFAKDFLVQSNIPTARFVVVEGEAERAVEGGAEARRAIERFGYPVVLKADGLAAGKGVVIAQDRGEAEAALAALRGRLVIEEFLHGEEVSFIALCDGRSVVPLAPTQDHKAAFDGDRGPNTGGMGAYCDGAILTAAEEREILERVIQPTVEATGFTGFLYAGLMMTAEGPKVLEFNVRLGDPETQPMMHRMASDFVPALMAAAEGALAGVKLEWRSGPSVCVVLASGGYPGAYETGKAIRGVEAAEAAGATVFHAGTRMGAQGLETAGGRVLGVTAGGETLRAAIEGVYRAVGEIEFAGMQYRRDIGGKGLRRRAV